jgi:lysophospholipase L1-like esterase
MYYTHQYIAYGLNPGYTRGDFERINTLGFRGPKFDFEKPQGTYRIVAIGGSTTFGVHLPHTKTYPVYLQQDLNERLRTDKSEVINAGLTGSASAESLHRLFPQILPLNPDMVVIYHGYNDIFSRILVTTKMTTITSADPIRIILPA